VVGEQGVGVDARCHDPESHLMRGRRHRQASGPCDNMTAPHEHVSCA
jgi:hypothetical protein